LVAEVAVELADAAVVGEAHRDLELGGAVLRQPRRSHHARHPAAEALERRRRQGRANRVVDHEREHCVQITRRYTPASTNKRKSSASSLPDLTSASRMP